jgi:hypothetical protein
LEIGIEVVREAKDWELQMGGDLVGSEKECVIRMNLLVILESL